MCTDPFSELLDTVALRSPLSDDQLNAGTLITSSPTLDACARPTHEPRVCKPILCLCWLGLEGRPCARDRGVPHSLPMRRWDAAAVGAASMAPVARRCPREMAATTHVHSMLMHAQACDPQRWAVVASVVNATQAYTCCPRPTAGGQWVRCACCLYTVCLRAGTMQTTCA